MYDEDIKTALDQLVPARTVRSRSRPSDPWFDQDCRAAKRQTRCLGRAAQRAVPNDAAAVAAATTVWTAQQRAYRALLRTKREESWQNKVNSE